MPRKRNTPDQHPAQRYAVGASIRTGVPLKFLIGPDSVLLLSESIAAVDRRFDIKRFVTRALDGLDDLEFKQRGEHVGRALWEQLGPDFESAAEILVAAFGPELSRTEKNGLAPFFYYPHACLIERFGVAHFDAGMRINYELTKRFTAEFSIRPFLVAHQVRALKLLSPWTADPNPHVRRLVCEGTRPRLPWASRLTAFQQDPSRTLSLLEKLKDDPERYVQRSVANHLGDILKDHPEAAYETCERWLEETRSDALTAEQIAARHWLLRHAVRLPAKKGDRRALAIRKSAKR